MSDAITTETIEITRTFDAPRELVFQAWIDPKHLVRWYSASEGWSTPYAETDPRAGGTFKVGFQSPNEGESFDFEATYDEVVEPERIVFTIGDGRPVTVTFEAHDGKTTLRLILTLETTHSAEQQREGWTAMLVNLENYLASAD